METFRGGSGVAIREDDDDINEPVDAVCSALGGGMLAAVFDCWVVQPARATAHSTIAEASFDEQRGTFLRKYSVAAFLVPITRLPS